MMIWRSVIAQVRSLQPTWFRTFEDSLRAELVDSMIGARIHGRRSWIAVHVAEDVAGHAAHRLPIQAKCRPRQNRPDQPRLFQTPPRSPSPSASMLDLADFVAERGGNVNKIKESQRRRFASEADVDTVVTLYEEARAGKRCPFRLTERYTDSFS